MSKQSLQADIDEYQDFINGIQKHATNINMTIASQTYTTAQVVQILQSLVTAGTSVLSTKTAWHDAVQGNQQMETQYAAFITNLRQTITAMYSNAESTLADFGRIRSRGERMCSMAHCVRSIARAA